MAAIDQLSEAHKRFVRLYAQSLNKVKAYMEVYPNSSYNAANVSSYDLLKLPQIKAAIEEEFASVTMSKSEVLKRITAIAEIDVSDFMSDSGELNIAKIKESGAGYLIKSISDTKFGKRVDLYDSQKALETLAKIYGLFNDGAKVTVNINQEISAKEKLQQTLDRLDAKLNGTVKT